MWQTDLGGFNDHHHIMAVSVMTVEASLLNSMVSAVNFAMVLLLLLISIPLSSNTNVRGLDTTGLATSMVNPLVVPKLLRVKVMPSVLNTCTFSGSSTFAFVGSSPLAQKQPVQIG